MSSQKIKECHLIQSRSFIDNIRYWREIGLLGSLGIALILAVIWWLFAIVVVQNVGVTIWNDQRTDFTQVGHNLHNPYLTPRYVYPP